MLEGTIINKKYEIKKEIGKGAFGQVYLAHDLLSKNNLVAIKCINKKMIEEDDYLFKAFWKELEVMKLCKSENSVQLYEYFIYDQSYHIVMELCDSDLDLVLSKRKVGFSEKETKEIFLNLNNVFKIMDKENIIHRDLKLKNVMVKETTKIQSSLNILNIANSINNNSYDSSSTNNSENIKSNFNEINFIPKLADFGFSKIMEEDITRTKLGTPATMAPEVMMIKNYSKKADLWSVGVIMYQLLFKTLPFKAPSEKHLLNLIINSNGPKFPETYNISLKLKDLILKLLTVNPEKRLSWKEYFEHPFFSSENSVELENNIIINNNIKLENLSVDKVKLKFKFSD